MYIVCFRVNTLAKNNQEIARSTSSGRIFDVVRKNVSSRLQQGKRSVEGEFYQSLFTRLLITYAAIDVTYGSFTDSVDQDQSAQDVQSDLASTLYEKETCPLKNR